MLNELTADQKALKKVVKKEWIDKLTQFSSIDKEKLIRFIEFSYAKIHKPFPKIFICSDPLTAVKMAQKMGCKDIHTFHYFGNGYDNGWLAFYDFFARIGILKKSLGKLRQYNDIVECGAFAYIFMDKAVIAIAPPLFVKRDEKKRMHCETGPALAFPGGRFKSWRWHGARVTEQIILHPETLTKEQILAEKNSEVSRAIAERIGWKEYLLRVGAILVHQWFDETMICHYELYDFKQRQGSLQPRLLKMESPALNDGTRPYYIEPVPPQSLTCQAARRWQCDPARPDINECNRNPDVVFELEM